MKVNVLGDGPKVETCSVTVLKSLGKMLASKKVIPTSPTLTTSKEDGISIKEWEIQKKINPLTTVSVNIQEEIVEEIEVLPEIPLIEIENAEEIAVSLPMVEDKVSERKNLEIISENGRLGDFLDDTNQKSDAYDKYRMMLKCGLPIGAVLQRMKLDGVEASVQLLDKECEPNLVFTALEQSVSKINEKREEIIQTELEVAGEQKMPSDGCLGSTINDLASRNSPLPSNSEKSEIYKCPETLPEIVETQPQLHIDDAHVNEKLKEPEECKNLEIEQPSLSNVQKTGEESNKPLSLLEELKGTPHYAKHAEPETKEGQSLSESRALSAEIWVKKEVEKLLDEIRKHGYEEKGDTFITFGTLFKRYEAVSDSLVGIIIRAKKRDLLSYDGEMLFQGRDDLKIIKLDKENAELFAKNQPTISRQHSVSSPNKEEILAMKFITKDHSSALKRNWKTSNEESFSPATKVSSVTHSHQESLAQPSDLTTSVISKKVLESITNSFSSDSQQITVDSIKDIGLKPLVQASEEAVEATPSCVVEIVEDQVSIDNFSQSEMAKMTATEGNLDPSMLKERTNLNPGSAVSHATNSAEVLQVPISESGAADSAAETTEVCEDHQGTSEVEPAEIKRDPDDITGRGPPPIPIPENSLFQVEIMEDTLPLPPPPLPESRISLSQRKTSSILNKPRSPSKFNATKQTDIVEEHSMFDRNGRRRSSGTVYRVALNVMDSKTVAIIPRDDITDALNWTVEDNDTDIFSYENAQGVELGRALEHLMSNSPPSKQAVKNKTQIVRSQYHAAILIQRLLRGWIIRLRYRSCLWVRQRLNSAVRSRIPEKVEEALAASRAISVKFVRPPEHEKAISSLDTIREEKAIRPKLLELSEIQLGAIDLGNTLKKFASIIERMNRCRLTDQYAFRDEVACRAELVYEAMLQRIDISSRLSRACHRLSPNEMMQALRDCDAAASKYTGIWEENFLEKEKRKVRSILVAIQHEEPSLLGLLKECTSTKLAKAHPETIFQHVHFDALENAIAKAVDEVGIEPVTPGALQILTLGGAMLSLRQTLSQAVAAGNAQKPMTANQSWSTSEKLLGEAREKLKRWVEAIPEKTNEGPDYFASWITAIEEELDLISHELDKKAGVHELIAALFDSVERCDIDDIRNVLRKGEKRGLQERVHDLPLQEALTKAKDYLEKYSLIHARLAEALSGVNRNPIELRRIADEARSIVLPNSTDSRLVQECDRLCQLAELELAPLIVHASETVPDREALDELVLKIRKQERMGGMRELEKLEQLIAMDEERLIQEQLRAASRHQNEERRVKLSIRFREIHLEQNPGMFRFHNFTDLKDPKEWSSEASSKRYLPGNLLKRETRASRMLYSTRTPIQTPLTKSAESAVNLKRFSLRANRTLLAYCGDLEVDDMTEFGGDVCQGLHELLVFALGEHKIRDEIYCQIMKHLTENRRPGSVTRSWNFLAFCLLTFPPSSVLDLYLEYFIRSNAPAPDVMSLLDKLHQGVFMGERPTAPTLNEIKSRQDDGGSVEGLGRRIKN